MIGRLTSVLEKNYMNYAKEIRNVFTQNLSRSDTFVCGFDKKKYKNTNKNVNILNHPRVTLRHRHSESTTERAPDETQYDASVGKTKRTKNYKKEKKIPLELPRKGQ